MKPFRRRLLTMAVGVVVSALTITVAPAHAADGLELSRDGATWGSVLDGPLFDPERRWVPGDSQTRTFYVRNQGPTSAQLTIEARSADTDELLARDDVHLSARAVGQDWVELTNGVPSVQLTQQSIVREGAVPVDVNVSFAAESANRSQNRELTLSLRVTLTDALEESVGEAPTDGEIPATGSSVGRQFIWFGAMLVGIGLALIVRRRTRDEEVGHV